MHSGDIKCIIGLCVYATGHLVSAGCCVGVCCQGRALLKATHLRRWASPSVSMMHSSLSV